MDIGSITAVVITAINIGGWIFSFGKLNGKVEELDKITERHEKLLTGDGLIDKINNCETQIANLKGSVDTYIDLTKDRNKDLKEN